MSIQDSDSEEKITQNISDTSFHYIPFQTDLICQIPACINILCKLASRHPRQRYIQNQRVRVQCFRWFNAFDWTLRQTYGTHRERFRGAGDHTCWGDLNRFGYQTDAVDIKKDEKKLDNGRIAWYNISVLIKE